MIRSLSLLCIVLCCISLNAFSQKITYSESIREGNRDMLFEILGKIGDNYIVYKNIRQWKHALQVMDKDMNILSNKNLSFISNKTFNIDFVTYPDFFYMIYQFQKNNTVFCNAVKVNAAGDMVGPVIQLDTTRIGIINNNRIYDMAYSEDRQQILVYKMQKKQSDLHILTKRFNQQMQLIDSVRNIVDFDDRRDVFSPFQVANDGTIIAARETKTGNRENINRLELFSLSPGSRQFAVNQIHLAEKYIDDVQIKVDNLNKNYIINSFYYTSRTGSIAGLFSTVVNPSSYLQKTVFNPFDDSLRLKMSNGSEFRFAFDNLFLRNIFLKKDGSYMIVAEDYSTQYRGGSNRWNRWDYIYGSPYIYNSNYYVNNTPGYRYYRPYNSFYSGPNVRHQYENLLLAGVDSSLKLQWSNMIYKKQADDDNDNFLSYITMNSGAEIHFLFLHQESNTQVISNQSISPSGSLIRYATLKSRESGYQFMPRLGKQVGIRQMLIPCIYRGNIAFAKIDFAAN